MTCSHPIPPVSWPTSAVSDCKHYDFRSEVLVHNAEGKLPQGVFSEIVYVKGPALGSIPDPCYRLSEDAFKVDGCNRAALLIPS